MIQKQVLSLFPLVCVCVMCVIINNICPQIGETIYDILKRIPSGICTAGMLKDKALNSLKAKTKCSDVCSNNTRSSQFFLTPPPQTNKQTNYVGLDVGTQTSLWWRRNVFEFLNDGNVVGYDKVDAFSEPK